MSEEGQGSEEMATAHERAKRLAGIRELQHFGPDAPAFWLAMQVPFLITEIDAAREDYRHAVSDFTNALAEIDAARAQVARLEAELAALCEAACDADLKCWGPAYDRDEAPKAAHRLRVLAQPWDANGERTKAGWVLLDKLRGALAQVARLREALEQLEAVARLAPQSARLARARASARAALATDAGRTYRAELIKRCAKVAEAYEPECESCPRGVVAAIRALAKEGT